jgi:hypothetical protein
MTGSDYAIALSVFFATYCLFEGASKVLSRRIGGGRESGRGRS